MVILLTGTPEFSDLCEKKLTEVMPQGYLMFKRQKCEA